MSQAMRGVGHGAGSAHGSGVAVRTYFGWQPEKVAFLFGMSGRRAALLVAAVLTAVWPLAVAQPRVGLLTWPLALLLTVMVFARVAGRTLDEWAASAVSWQLLAWRDHHKWLSGPFTPPAVDDGHIFEARAVEDATTRQSASSSSGSARPVGAKTEKEAGGRGGSGWRRWPRRGPGAVDLPGVLAPLQILEAPGPGPAGSGGVAVVHHRLDRTLTAVARVRFPGVGLVDSARRETRVAGWGGLLAGLCTEGNPIIRVQTLQRISPASGAQLRRWHRDHLDPVAPAIAVQVAEELLGAAGDATSQRESFLPFTMDLRRASTSIKAAGGGTGAAAAVLGRHLRALGSSIAGADLQIESWLDVRDLGEVIRVAYDPHSARHLAERRATHSAQVSRLTARTDPDRPGPDGSTGQPQGETLGRDVGMAAGVPIGAAGPVAAEARAGSYRHDGGISVTYAVHDWPRSQVHATVLAPLLGESVHRRSVAMHFEPLGPRVDERDVMRERTARSVAVRMRQRTGQIVPEHEQVALERARAQDVDRAAGHGLVRFTAYVTLTVVEEADLEDACAELEADAAAARVELRRMWFAQDVGFTMGALPLGYGLPRKRW